MAMIPPMNPTPIQKVRVGVVGASGYSGIELVRMLLTHPGVELTYVAGSRDRAEKMSKSYPFLYGGTELSIEQYHLETCVEKCDAVFVALPSGASGKVAAELWHKGVRVIDLSGDLRLPSDLYSPWYGKEPVDADVVLQAVYGLTEWNRDLVRDASLIANPGCYATTILMALLPIVRAGLVQAGAPIIVDAKSGVSGAGRHPTVNTMFGELEENFYAYKVGRHQHTPEVELQLSADLAQRILMTTQLIPAVRGIYAVSYIPTSSVVHSDDIAKLYAQHYEGEPFVSVREPGDVPEMKHVRGSNQCHIGFAVDDRTGLLQVFSTLDNLQKGAAGQALQNFNCMYGYEETTALPLSAVYP